jgi:hypothetical protein
MAKEYTNAKRLIDRAQVLARDLSDVLNRARSLAREAERVGGDERLSPVFFTLEEPVVPREDMGFSLAELNTALAGFKVFSALESPIEGMSAQLEAYWSAFDKIKV